MSQIIDRRLNSGKKSTVNRQRFLRRFKNQIKEAVTHAAEKRSITEIDQGEKISIPSKDLQEPHFQQGQGGRQERILPGNDQFQRGDKIPKPKAANDSSHGQTAGQHSAGEDEFVFELSREEFLDLYFEDLELPDLIKKDLASLYSFKTVRQGIATSGIPANINVVRSMRQASGRRIALAGPHQKKLAEAQKALQDLEDTPNADESLKEQFKEKILILERKIQAIPFIDTLDLRYNRKTRIAIPSTQAVMFCIMDVSGSMDEAKKEIAKRFFILLYLFLTKNYEKIELVFIRHHTSAKQVSEEEFFYSRETGGTVVSSALELLVQVIHQKYSPSQWNIYIAQASDGDNWNADSPYCRDILSHQIMPLVQYFAYIEIMPRTHQSLWEMYKNVQSECANFAMEHIENVADIYPVFRELFKRKTA